LNINSRNHKTPQATATGRLLEPDRLAKQLLSP
jgi:hypothetical protein